VFTEKDAAWLENENPFRWLDGGKSFLWLSERSGWRHAYRAHSTARSLEPITKGEFDIIAVEAVDEAGGWLYYAASPKNATQRHLFRAKLDGSKTEQLSPEKQAGWHEYAFSPDAQWAVHTFSNFTTPPVVELVRLSDNTAVRTLADNAKLRAKLAALKRPEIEFFRVPIGGGVLDGWSIKPPSVGTRREAAAAHVRVRRAARPNRARRVARRARAVALDARPAGLRGGERGQPRNQRAPRPRVAEGVHRKIGILAPTEQAAAVRELLKRWPFVDPARVGSWGWSGGGSMSLNALFRHPDLYRTAIAVAPVADQTLYDTIYQERYMGLPADNAAATATARRSRTRASCAATCCSFTAPATTTATTRAPSG
jgi:dipeptidyl-peptidase 4